MKLRPYQTYATLALLAVTMAIPVFSLVAVKLLGPLLTNSGAWFAYTFFVWFFTLVGNGSIVAYVVRKSFEWNDQEKDEEKSDKGNQPPDDFSPA